MGCLFNFDNYKNNIALITNDREVTYKELDQLSYEVGMLLDNKSLVLLVCTNTIDSIISYIGIIKSGAKCLLVANTDIESLLEKYKPQYVFSPIEKNINAKVIKEFGSYIACKTNFDVDYEINNELAILLTTSGSTGSPKFVRLSYNNIVSNTTSISEYLKIKSSDRAITTMPMNYTYGLSIINTHLANGASLILTDESLMSKIFWSLIKEKKATNFGGVPYTYEMLKKLRFERVNLPDLKYITQAGGKLNKKLVLDFYEVCSKKNIKFYVMYGQTEATSRMSYLPLESLPEKAGSIGIAIPDGKFLIKDDKGCEIEDIDVRGELVYIGNNVSYGYSQSYHDLKEGDKNYGCLHTGDLATKDADDYFYIVGRKNRFIKVYGNRVNLDEFEHIITSYGYECVCTGEDDKLNIFLTDNTIEKLFLFNKLMKDTGLNKSAFNLVYIDSIPRSDSGKIIYYKLDSGE
ncbi:MAG: AMP-dependent synthetase [Arcobacter sp.]|nr:MAG: AMP-dependent synthetase [Arcobacter sp.]